MVCIKLDSEYNLESDSSQFIISKNGRAISFHMSIEHAILSFFERKIRNCNAESMSALLKVHKECINSLQQALTPLKIEIHVKKTSELKKNEGGSN